MKKILHVGFLLAIAFSLNECVFTLLVWNLPSPSELKVIENDKIYAFMLNKKEHRELEKDSLVMIGRSIGTPYPKRILVNFWTSYM